MIGCRTTHPERIWTVVVALAALTLSPGAVNADGGFTIWGDYHLDAGATLEVTNGLVKIAGDFDVAINDYNRFDLTTSTLQFIGSSGEGPYDVETLAQDAGFCGFSLPDQSLFSIKKLRIGPSGISVRLVDNHDNAAGAGAEALYVEQLVLEAGTTLDVAGHNVYYVTVTPANAGQPGSGVTITDSVGGGGIVPTGTGSASPPTGPAATPSTICQGDTSDLSGTVGGGFEIDWYTGSCGGTLVGTGNPLSVSPATTTTYYGRARDTGGSGCVSSTCASVTVTVGASPNCTITAPPGDCDQVGGLTASVASAGMGATYTWMLTGGSIISGQGTNSITYSAGPGGSVTIDVTVTNGGGCDSDCQTIVNTTQSDWTGANNGLFTVGSNWDPAGAPGGAAVLQNTTSVDNTCILNAAGETSLCSVSLSAIGSGDQILRVDSGSSLRMTGGLGVEDGGVLRLQSAAQAIVDGADMEQSGEIEIRSNATLAVDGGLTNLDGGVLTIYDGTLAAASTDNQLNASIQGFGTIDSDLTNDGFIGTLADTQIIGDLTNNGTIIITNGFLTIIGTLTNNGDIIGQPGLRSPTAGFVVGGDLLLGEQGGLAANGSTIKVRGSVDIATADANRIAWAGMTLQLDGLTDAGAQTFEMLSPDLGRDVSAAEAIAFGMYRLRVGPSATTVQLVDNRHNTVESGEALYVSELVLDRGVTLDLAGKRLYYGSVTPADPHAVGSGVTVIDSVGGGILCAFGPAIGSGDFDGDCRTTASDVTQFVATMLGQAADGNAARAADMNADGHADGLDIGLFVRRIAR